MRALMTQEDAALERYMAEVKRIPMLEREEALTGLEGSLAWRLALGLRGLRHKVIPPGSRAEDVYWRLRSMLLPGRRAR